MQDTFNDHFSDVSLLYKNARPTYPAALYPYLASLVKHCNVAWDCATGNGQAALMLTNHFDLVIATDASEAQLKQAPVHPKLVYDVAYAESSLLDEESIDLVCVAQALHWFDVPAFYREANRVLKPRGVLAVWTYRLLDIEPEIDSELRYFAHELLEPYWPKERKYVEEGYRSLSFPYKELNVPAFNMEAEWTVDQLISYLHTWSAVSRYKKQNGSKTVNQFCETLRSRWNGSTKRVQWPFILRCGTKK